MKKRSDKEIIVHSIKSSLNENESVFIVKQDKLTVADSESLRNKLRTKEASYFVCKNTLARLAIKDTKYEEMTPMLNGQMALVFAKSVTEGAKVIDEYAAANDKKLEIIGGFFDKVLTAGDVKMLSKLPSLNELRSRIIATIQTPAQRIATILAAPGTQVARVLNAYAQKEN